MADFKKLLVWQKSYALALKVRRISSHIRAGENMGLKSQIVRASDSIPANIVEGRGQESPRTRLRAEPGRKRFRSDPVVLLRGSER